MKQFFLWLWQFPQNLIGFCLTRFRKQTLLFTFNDGTTGRIYFTNNVFGCGVSLGNYIILDYGKYWQYRYYDSVFRTYNHVYLFYSSKCIAFFICINMYIFIIF